MKEFLRQENNPVIFIENPNICGKCAANGPTCCQCGMEEKELVAPLSEAEWLLIQKMVPWTKNGAFVVQEKNTPFFREEIAKLFPEHQEDVESSFPANSFHLRLAQNHLGQCTFLGPQGCLLPKAARPHFCNIYPFWFIGRHLQAFGDPHCEVLKSRDTVPQICAALHTHPDDIFQVYLSLCLDWGISPPSQDLQVEIQ